MVSRGETPAGERLVACRPRPPDFVPSRGPVEAHPIVLVGVRLGRPVAEGDATRVPYSRDRLSAVLDGVFVLRDHGKEMDR